MRRREVLAGVAGVASISALAGCVVDDGTDPRVVSPATESDPPSNETGPDESQANPPDPESDDPFERHDVGSIDEDSDRTDLAGVIWVTNEVGDSRPVDLKLEPNDPAGGVDESADVPEPVERTVSLPDGAFIEFRLGWAGSYALDLAVETDEERTSRQITVDTVGAGGTGETTDDEHAETGCYLGVTTVTLTEERIETRSETVVDSTEEIDVEDATVTVEDADCASGPNADEATVDIDTESDPEELRVEGLLRAPTPCYEVRIEEIESESGELSLTVAAEGGDETTCIQCLGDIEYAITGQLVGGTPRRVVVNHERDGDRTVITESTCGG